MNVLIACEHSQTVCKAFRELGHIAFSCDIIECSGGHPEWHILGDVLFVLNPHEFTGFFSSGICFNTQDGVFHYVGKWDMIIAHPPCTYLTRAATQCHSLKKYSIDDINIRTYHRIDAMKFFMQIVTADCDKIIVENPIGVMNTAYRQPDQIIQPFYFSNGPEDVLNFHYKTTCLWLKGVPPLTYSIPDDPKNYLSRWSNGKVKHWTESNNGSYTRSLTFPGIAKAMAEQWGGIYE